MSRDVTLLLPPGAPTESGNAVSADRWARALAAGGHRTRVTAEPPARADVLVALHAERNAAPVLDHARRGGALVVVLSGTDVYRPGGLTQGARAALAAADRVVVLQPLALDELELSFRDKARVIVQAAPDLPSRRTPHGPVTVAYVAGVRAVKDPLTVVSALERLGPDSELTVDHYGVVLDEGLAATLRARAEHLPRYRFHGAIPRATLLERLAGAHALVLPSRTEGGANVLSEALGIGLPVLASRVAGSVGLLGADYPGLFDAGDAAGLAHLFDRFERDLSFREDLERRCAELGAALSPEAEQRAWLELVEGLPQSC